MEKITFKDFLEEQSATMPGVYHAPGSPAYLTAVRIYNGLGMAFPDRFVDRIVWPSAAQVSHGNRSLSVTRQEDMAFITYPRASMGLIDAVTDGDEGKQTEGRADRAPRAAKAK